jgi:hypothetical protein
MYRPNARALALLQQDVLAPWLANQTMTLSGRFAARKAARIFVVKAPLDGTLSASVTSGARVAVFAGKRRLTGSSATVETTVCGTRTLTFRVTRATRTHGFTLTVSRP